MGINTNTTTVYNFVNSAVAKNKEVAAKLSAIILFDDWDNIEAINKVFPFLTEPRLDKVMTNISYLGQPQEEVSYRKEVFGSRYTNWMQWIFNTYRSEAPEIVLERVQILGKARTAALCLISFYRNKELVVMTRKEYKNRIANAVANSKALNSKEIEEPIIEECKKSKPILKIKESSSNSGWVFSNTSSHLQFEIESAHRRAALIAKRERELEATIKEIRNTKFK